MSNNLIKVSEYIKKYFKKQIYNVVNYFLQAEKILQKERLNLKTRIK